MRRLLVLLFLLVWVSPAAALPGDPPIELRSPAAGASLPTDPAGIEVSYTCPLYRSADYGDGHGIINGEDAYTVLMSDLPQLDGDGRLANPVSRRIGASRPADPNLCFVRLGNDDLNPRPQVTPGTWYWQASRICSGCTPQPPFEVSEVRSFTLVPATKPTLGVPARVYAGFPFIAALRGTLPAAGTVNVERKVGSGWKSVGTGAISGGVSNATTVLPKGRQTLRARVDSIVSAERTVTVKPGSAKKTKVRGGRWTGRRSTSFRVVGRSIKKLATNVALLCPTPGMVNQFTTQIATAAVSSIRLAPDGSFVGASTDSGAVRVYGRLKGGKLVGGRVEMSLGVCAGSASFSATR